MQILLPILIALSAFYLSKFIRTNSTLIYLVAIVLASASIMNTNSTYLSIINTGLLGLSFYIIVMYTGVLEKGSKIKKKLSSVRREYAIIGFIFLTPHAYLNIYNSITNVMPLELLGLLAYLLMIPLFITSFKLIRINIPTSSWLKLHRFSYLVYFLMLLYIIRISEPRIAVLYTIIYGVYSVLKLSTFFEKKALLKATTFTLLISVSSLFFINDVTSYFDDPYDIITSNSFVDGTYIGYAKGYRNLDTVVRVVITENKIEYVIIDKCGCTPIIHSDEYINAAFQTANDIRVYNRTDIDSIAGSTKTSEAINQAVINALKNAIIE